MVEKSTLKRLIEKEIMASIFFNPMIIDLSIPPQFFASLEFNVLLKYQQGFLKIL